MILHRFDRASLRAPRQTPAGMLLVEARAARVGIQEYDDGAGGVRRELRTPDEVFAEPALSGYRGATLTNDHPSEGVTPVIWRGVAVGTVLSAKADGDHVLVEMVISDAAAIADVEAGKRELSAGYEVTLDRTPGTDARFGRYDAVQRGIKINHLALVDAGRCGGSCALRADATARDCTCAPANPMPLSNGIAGHAGKNQAKEHTTMDLATALAALAAAQTKNGELQANLTAATQLAVQEKARADKAEGERDTARADASTQKARADKAEGERDSEKARADQAEKARTDAAPAAVAARVALERTASAILGAEVDLSKKTDRQIKVDVIKKVDDADVSDEKAYADAYVNGRFDACVSRGKQAAQALDTARAAAGGPAPQPGATGEVVFDSAASIAAEQAARAANDLAAQNRWMTLADGETEIKEN